MDIQGYEALIQESQAAMQMDCIDVVKASDLYHIPSGVLDGIIGYLFRDVNTDTDNCIPFTYVRQLGEKKERKVYKSNDLMCRPKLFGAPLSSSGKSGSFRMLSPIKVYDVLWHHQSTLDGHNNKLLAYPRYLMDDRTFNYNRGPFVNQVDKFGCGYGYRVRRTCQTALCINPHHLEAITV
jgi:hypothetical protein